MDRVRRRVERSKILRFHGNPITFCDVNWMCILFTSAKVCVALEDVRNRGAGGDRTHNRGIMRWEQTVGLVR
jgi:hypothetical protein